MSYVNVLGEAPDATSKRIRVNQSGQLLAATADFPPNGSVLLGTTAATALQADSVPLAIADPQGRPGWYYSNTTLGDKINWYYYDGSSNNFTYSELNQLTCVMTCDGAAPSGVINVPYFVVYTKTGKTVIYQSSSSIEYIRGQKVLFYFSADAFSYPQNPDQLREVACPILESPSRPTPGPNEEILYITVHSDSAYPATTFTGCISQLGFRFNENTVIYQLEAPATSSGSDVNITNTFLDTHAALYVGGTAVGGTNPVPVSFTSAPSAPQYTVLINDTGDPLEVDGTTLQVGNTSLSSMTFDTNNLNVRVANTSIPITNTNIDSLSFTTDKGINYLNTSSTFGFPIQNNALKTIIYDSSTGNNPNSAIYPLYVRSVASSITTNEWTIANFSGTGVGSVSEALEASNSDSITVFGVATHSGGGGDPTLTYQYSIDNITYYDTPYLITLSNATSFENTRALGVPWVRFKITSHALDTITLNICRK